MRLFVSYSRKDIDAANYIAAELRKRGAEVFIDYQRLQAGENFVGRLAQEIEQSDCLILVFSLRSAGSRWVQDEAAYAHHLNKRIIPVMLESVEDMTEFFFLIRVERVDFTRWQSDRQVADAIRKLATSLHLPEVPIETVETASQTPQMVLPDVSNILPPPFEWCEISGGRVTLKSANTWWYLRGGTRGGKFEVDAFALANYPITNEQYQVFVGASDGYRDRQWWDYSAYAMKWRDEHLQATDTFFAGDELPLTNVSWYDALAFCRWLSSKTERKITLPTEHQWQRAAQGDTRSKYPWGDTIDSSYCNYGARVGGPTPVTLYPKGASPYGVLGMCGNVWEWCLTLWGTDSIDIESREWRVVRGGSWKERDVPLAWRGRSAPKPAWPGLIGFRVALCER